MTTVESGPTRRRMRTLALMAGASLLMAACGAQVTDERSVPALPTDESAAAAGENGTDPDGDNADGDGDGDELSQEEAVLAYEQCLADNGLDPGEFFGGGGGETIGGDDNDGQSQALTFDSEEEFEEFERINEECGESLSDAFGDFELSPEEEAAQRDAELQFNQCMADQGFPLQESDAGDGTIEFAIDPDADLEAMDDAFEQCQDVLNDVMQELFGDAEEEG